MTMTHPDYAMLASRIAVSNLHKNTQKSFSEVISRLRALRQTPWHPAPLISDETAAIVKANARELDSAIVYARDNNYDYFGFKTMERSYLLRINGEIVERPQHMLMRVAVGIHGATSHAALRDIRSDVAGLVHARVARRCSTPERRGRSCRRASSSP